jgi:hypothetical protein
VSGFAHDIAGGQGNLIVTAVQSPNFVAGSVGWQIRKDGSAEFNNGTFRGTVTASTFQGTNFTINSSGEFFYSGAPASGNLVASIATAAGTDSVGNAYLAGLVSYTNNGGTFQACALTSGGMQLFWSLSAGGPWNSGSSIGTNNIGQFIISGSGNPIRVASGSYLAATDPSNSNAVETWHDMRPLSNSFVGTIASRYPPQYRRSPDGAFVDILGFVQFPGSGGPNFNTVTFSTLPASYRPSANTGQKWPTVLETNVTPVGTPVVQIDTSGNLQFHNCPASGMASNVANISGRYPLDVSGVIQS